VFPLSDKFDKTYNNFESGNEIDDFLRKFDEIKQSFIMADSETEDPEVPKDPATRQERSFRTDTVISPRRAERLNRIQSKKEKNKESNKTNNDTEGFVADNMAKKKKKKKYRINIKRLLIALICVAVLSCGAVGVWALTVISDTPPINADNIYSMLSENSVIYDDAGNEIENLFASGAGLRTNLNFTEMPEDLINAFIAIEDKTFWEHGGFNVVRIFGAIWDSLTSGDSIRGTSTITQQLARNLYLEDTKSERSLKRKVQEAYYAVQLERQLSKEQIIEAYLNTISLGSGAYGVQAAAQTYFSKDVNDLTLAECAVLACIPKSPSKYSPLKRLYNEDISDPDSLDFVYRGETFSIWYQDEFLERQKLVLSFMKDQGLIDEERYQEAINQDIRAAIKPNIDVASEISSYFADYLVNEVVQDLMFEYDLEESAARNMIYNGGLRIYSTLNVPMQKIIETEFEKSSNFPDVTGLNRDKEGNARDANGKILLYKYSNMFDEEGNFTLKPEEYRINEDGSMTVFKGNRLNIYKTEVQGNVEYSVEFKSIYTIEDGIFYTIPTGYILIPSEYKNRDEDGNLVIHKDFFGENFPFTLTEAGMTIPKGYYQLKEKVIQPQSAMVIIDYKTGAIKAMAGGRSLSGKLLYNRATSTRQPGSAIKPMAVYGPALQLSVDMVKNNAVDENARLWTAASVIDDAPLVLNGKLWPKNWYSGYRGLHTLRRSVEQSVNVNAVKVFNELGAATSLAFLKQLGITSVVESGSVNDMNPAALALGGMTKGISPLEMAAGYGSFANQGLYVEPVPYTKVTNKRGEILLESNPNKKQVMDRGVAFIMTDILRTTVTNGIAKAAAIGSHTVAGKTGTTTDNYDAWFVGMTPHYVAALWIGNDINLELSQGSVAAARLWSKVMKQVHVGLPAGSFPQPDNVVSATIDTMSGLLPSELSALDPRGTVRSEYFVSGTVPTATDNMHVAVTVCNDSGYLATPYCYNTASKVMIRRPEGSVLSYGGFTVADIEYEAPYYFCNRHNYDTAAYPIDPNVQLQTDPWSGGQNGIPPWLDQNNGNNGNAGNNGNNRNGNNGNGGQNPPVTDSHPNPIVSPEDSEKPEWLN
jgi:penicillin-binding protein 1A